MKKILVYTSWFPNEFELTKCVFVKNIVDAQYSKNENIAVVVPKVFFAGLKFKFLPLKYKKSALLKKIDYSHGYVVYRPYIFKIPFLGKHINYLMSYFSMALFFKLYKLNEYDIIHTHGLLPDGYIGAKLGSLFKIPVVVHVHDSYLEKIYKENARFLRCIFHAAKALISVSNFQNEILKGLVGSENEGKCKVVYNGINPSLFSFNENKHSVRNNRLLFIGNLIPVKGLDVLLKAISLLKDENFTVQLDIIGKGSSKNIYEKCIRDLNLGSQVKFLGIVDNSKLPQILNRYSGFVLPSRYETFGIVLIEAMSAGVPVLGSSAGAIPEIISDAGFIFENEDPLDLAMKIKSLFETNWDYMKISSYGNKFNLDETVRLINNIYYS